MFWYLLSDAGLLPVSREELKDDEFLRDLYETRFSQEYRLGLVNMIDRPSRDISDLKKGEEEPGRRRLERIIAKYQPRIVCFVGKVTYEKFTGIKKFDYGWKEPINESRIYVMHTPLRGEARVRIEELREIKESLG